MHTKESSQLQEELMEVITNDELKYKVKSTCQQFWLQKDIPMTYTEIWAVIQKFLVALLSLYLVEHKFNNQFIKIKETD